jgi:hypothetical protein
MDDIELAGSLGTLLWLCLRYCACGDLSGMKMVPPFSFSMYHIMIFRWLLLVIDRLAKPLYEIPPEAIFT